MAQPHALLPRKRAPQRLRAAPPLAAKPLRQPLMPYMRWIPKNLGCPLPPMCCFQAGTCAVPFCVSAAAWSRSVLGPVLSAGCPSVSKSPDCTLLAPSITLYHIMLPPKTVVLIMDGSGGAPVWTGALNVLWVCVSVRVCRAWRLCTWLRARACALQTFKPQRGVAEQTWARPCE